MRGNNALVTMRNHGAVPAVVWIDTDAGKLPMSADWLEVSPQHAHLQLDATERPHRLDLRCVVGLTVSIGGSDLERVRATRDACIKAGAKRVIAATSEPFGRGEWVAFRMIEMTDTAGQLVHEMEPRHG